MHLTRINYIVVARIKTRESSYEKDTFIEENPQSKGNKTLRVSFNLQRWRAKCPLNIEKITSCYHQSSVHVSSPVIKSFFFPVMNINACSL